MSRLPTVGGDDNSWGDVLNDFLGVEHNADGTQKTLPLTKGGTGSTTAAGARTNLGAEATSNKGIAGGYAPLDGTGKVPAGNLPSGGGGGSAAWPDIQTRYVSTGGSDTNDGLSPLTPKATIAAAVAALPDSHAGPNGPVWGGGTVIIAPGSYDLYNGGNYLQIYERKMITFTSPTGTLGARISDYGAGGGSDSSQNVYLYSSVTPPDAMILLGSAGSGIIGQGHEFHGLYFRLDTQNVPAVHARNCNHVRFYSCGVIGNDLSNQYMCKSDQDAGDNSWYRFIDNETNGAGLHYAGNHGNAANNLANCNQHVWAYNTCFYNGPIIDLYGGTRCLSIGNNIEGPVPVTTGILLTFVSQSAFVFDGGEGKAPFIKFCGARVSGVNTSNIIMPLGSTSGGTYDVIRFYNADTTTGVIGSENPDIEAGNMVISPFRDYWKNWPNRNFDSELAFATSAHPMTVNEKWCICTGSSNFTVTLPSPTDMFWTRSSVGGERKIVRRGTGTITIATASGSIVGNTTLDGAAGKNSATFVTDGLEPGTWYQVDGS